MKFKIIEVGIKGSNLLVAISHEECEREVFGFPPNFAENNLYIEKIKKILDDREKMKTQKFQIDTTMIDKEF